MRRLLSINKVSFSAALGGMAAVAFTPFLTFRANRIAAGKGVYLLQTEGYWGAVVLMIWVMLVLATLLRGSSRWHSPTVSGLSCLLLLLIFYTAGHEATLTTRKAGSIARISMGPAFWIGTFTVLAIMGDAWQKWRQGRRMLILMILITLTGLAWMLLSGRLDMLSIMRELANRRDRFYEELVTHLALAGSSVGMALVIGLPIGILVHRKKGFTHPTFFTLNTFQTIPSLALFGILIPVLAAITSRFPILGDMGIKGIGTAPAIIALTVYSLLPIVRNTYTGFRTVAPGAVEAGMGMGMSRTQLLFQVEIPIASPVILNGIRVALVQAVGLTAVAALIGAGGFGVFIFQGLGQAANDLILLGALPTILIAVMADLFMAAVTISLKPRGLR